MARAILFEARSIEQALEAAHLTAGEAWFCVSEGVLWMHFCLDRSDLASWQEETGLGECTDVHDPEASFDAENPGNWCSLSYAALGDHDGLVDLRYIVQTT